MSYSLTVECMEVLIVASESVFMYDLLVFGEDLDWEGGSAVAAGSCDEPTLNSEKTGLWGSRGVWIERFFWY